MIVILGVMFSSLYRLGNEIFCLDGLLGLVMNIILGL